MQLPHVKYLKKTLLKQGLILAEYSANMAEYLVSARYLPRQILGCFEHTSKSIILRKIVKYLWLQGSGQSRQSAMQKFPSSSPGDLRKAFFNVKSVQPIKLLKWTRESMTYLRKMASKKLTHSALDTMWFRPKLAFSVSVVHYFQE